MGPLAALGIFIAVAGTVEKVLGAGQRARDARNIAEQNAHAAEEAAADAEIGRAHV